MKKKGRLKGFKVIVLPQLFKRSEVAAASGAEREVFPDAHPAAREALGENVAGKFCGRHFGHRLVKGHHKDALNAAGNDVRELIPQG